MSSNPQRVAGYCRTSSEGQRNNTSIPEQKSQIERLIEQNGWVLVRHYVDESKTGSKIAGREAFQQMMREAALGQFELVVVYDLTRFGRDGADIIESARTLSREFGVHLLDTKGNFDNRDRRRVLTNYVQAGVAEDERLRILERTMLGRINKAKQGQPWGSNPPVGRAYDEKKEKWHVTDYGQRIRRALERYVKGETLKSICAELDLPWREVSPWAWKGQLAGPYTVTFNSPDIGIVDHQVVVPGIPQVVSLTLLEKVRKRLQHNRTNNRVDIKKYLLSGFIRCEQCRRALIGQTHGGKVYYRHKRSPDCSFASVRAEVVEPAVLEFLYDKFLDEPAFNQAVKKAMPSQEQRKAVLKQRDDTLKLVKKNELTVQRLVDAIGNGADVGLLLSKQLELKNQKQALTKRLTSLEEQIATLPSAAGTKRRAMLTRISLAEQYKGRNWRKLPFDEVKQFLFQLFGSTTCETGTGIRMRKNSSGQLIAEFRGQIDFHHLIKDGRVCPKSFRMESDLLTRQIRTEFQKACQEAEALYGGEKVELRPSGSRRR